MVSVNGKLLARMIRNQRISYGFMQTELSRISGIPAFKISRVEQGRCFPSADFLLRISGILGMDRSQLLMCAAFAALSDPQVKRKSLHDILNAFHTFSSE